MECGGGGSDVGSPVNMKGIVILKEKNRREVRYSPLLDLCLFSLYTHSSNTLPIASFFFLFPQIDLTGVVGGLGIVCRVKTIL